MSHPIPRPAAGASRGAFAFAASWKTASTLALIMVVLALLGVALATTNADLARKYWMTLVPIYGLLCTVSAWRRSQQSGANSGKLVLRQILHWLAIGAAVLLDFAVQGAGGDVKLSSGSNSLLLLALGCVLAGVHLDWSFMLVGLLLGLTFVCVAKAAQYLWLIFVVGLLVIGVLIFAWRRLGASGEGDPAGG
jgi:hypothetical protein